MLFQTKTFTQHDDYMSPAHVWQDIEAYIPKDKTIWECFYGDGTSGQFLQQMGCDVIHEQIDFFKENRGDILVSNPPFSMKKEAFTRLKELGKPFIMISPSSMICYKYFRELFKDENIQIIIPRKRINFIKLVDGKTSQTKGCNFDCFYYCWKMNLSKDIIYL
jgi:hypothetical protein